MTVDSILKSRSYSTEEGEPDEYCLMLVNGVEANLDEIDAVIAEVSENWSVGRMPFVDRNILRLAVFEILFVEEVPASVAINEAVELAKTYGGEDSSKFVNGVLGRVAQRRRADESIGSEHG
jgi:N utilization substance protein B